MLSFKKSLIAIVGLAVLAGLIALVTPTSTQGQGGGNQQPLNVNVVNTASAPALVRDVSLPVRTPVQIKVHTYFQVGLEDVYTVPEGKRLVIEQVALASNNLVAGEVIRGTVITQFAGQTFDHHLDVRPQFTIASGTFYIANHPLLAFADQSTHVQVDARSAGGSSGNLEGTLSGYLESVP
jgi:hypothetical protein